MLRRKPKDQEWWYGYESPEVAKNLDWNDAMIEYMNRILPMAFQGERLPELPWEGSPFMREAARAHEVYQQLKGEL